MKLFTAMAMALSFGSALCNQTREFTPGDIDLLYNLLDFVRQQLVRPGPQPGPQKVSGSALETKDHFDRKRTKFFNSSMLYNVSTYSVKKPKKLISAGIYFDAIKNHEEDDDCEDEGKKWFWPFAVSNSTKTNQVPASSLVSFATKSSHGLFVSTRLVNASAPVRTTESASSSSTPTAAKYTAPPRGYFIQKSGALFLLIPSLLYLMLLLPFSY